MGSKYVLFIDFCHGETDVESNAAEQKSGIHHRRCPKDRAHAVKLASPVAGRRSPVAGRRSPVKATYRATALTRIWAFDKVRTVRPAASRTLG